MTRDEGLEDPNEFPTSLQRELHALDTEGKAATEGRQSAAEPV